MGVNTHIDVSEKDLNNLHQLLALYLPNTKVWAFGSRVKWTSRPDSDLDLVVFTTKEQNRQVHNLKDALQESSLPFRVDVLVWDNIPDTFRENIKQQYFVLVDLNTNRSCGMSSEWQEMTLGEFAPFVYGKSLPEKNRIAGEFPVASSAGIIGTHTTPLVKTGGIIVGRKGTVGSVTLCKTPFWVIDTAFYIPDTPDKDLLFTYYLFQTLGLSGMNSDSAVPGLNRDNAHAVPVLIPPLKEQQQIARYLSILDDRITLLRETNATLEAIAQALFKSWFVDFDPVHAKAQGRQPEGMDEQTAALFPDRFVESELGMVPLGWEVKTLSELCKITSGKRPNNRSDIATPTLKTPLFGGAGLMGFTNESLFDEPKIITGRVGTLGKNFIAHPPFWASDNALILSPLKNRDFYFCFHWLNGVDVHGLNRGAVQPLLTQKDLGSQQKAIPCNELTKAFSNMAKSIYCKIHHQSEQIKTLTNLRDTLLPRLISGQLRVRDVNVP